MDREDEHCRRISDGERSLLLAGQLRLLRTKGEEVRTLCGRGGGGSSRGEALANDLVGIRLVLNAALLTGGLGESEREELQRREREARELLREAVNTLIDRARHEDRL